MTGERRTRRADRWTTVLLAVLVVFSAWALVLLALTAAGVIQAAVHYTDNTTAFKAGLATAVAVLAAGQLYTMEAAMGHLPKGPMRTATLMRVHRWGGRLALSLVLVTAYLCLVNLGTPTDYRAQAVHGVLAAAAIGAIALKLGLIRFRRHAAYVLAPWLGRFAAFAFVVVWVTSVVAYSTGHL